MPAMEMPFTVNLEVRQSLMDAARALNERAERLDWDKPGNGTPRPGDLFNHCADIADVLKPHGWVSDASGKYWRRPGKTDRGYSATFGHCTGQDGTPLFYVFSSNAAPFEMNKCYSIFAVYALLNHDGDYSAAARALAEQGYSTGPAPAPQRNGHDQPKNPEPEPWQEPIPLTNCGDVEPFPLHVLPECLAHYAQAVAWAMSCPIDYVAVPMLAIAGSAIGISRSLEVKQGWRERACMYAAVVAPPGAAKSPALAAVARPVYREQAIRIARFKEEKTLWEDNPGNRPAPRLETLYADDATVEKLAAMLQDNQRGLVMIRDELAAWIGGMDQYKSGGKGCDRQFYLAMWAGSPIKIDRKCQDMPIFVHYPFIGVIGAIPPDMLNKLRGEHDLLDGFIDRILFSFPAPLPASGETWRQLDDETEAIWADVLNRLRALEVHVDSDGNIRPWHVRLTSCGRQAWERISNEMAAELNRNDISDAVKGSISKMRIYCVRLALIIHQMRLVTDSSVSEDVDGESMSRAADLVRYFKSHAFKVHGAMGSDWRIVHAEKILRWARDGGMRTFRKRDAYREIRSGLSRIEDMEKIMDLLVRHGFVRKVDRLPGTVGRPSESYEVNSLFLQKTGQNGQNPRSDRNIL